MKNKKLYNLYLLCISLLALVTFVIPMEKINPAGLYSVGMLIVYYVTGSLMCLALAGIIFVSIVGMFRDDYEGVALSQAFAVVAFFMVFVNLLVYASVTNQAISWGSILVAVEVFALFAFSRIIKMVYAFGSMKGLFIKWFPKKQAAEKTATENEPEKPVTVIKRKPSDKKEPVSDNKSHEDVKPQE